MPYFSPIARISPAKALQVVEKAPGLKKALDGITPQLNYYYDAPKSKWRLVYISQDVPVGPVGKGKTTHRAPLRMDFGWGRGQEIWKHYGGSERLYGAAVAKVSSTAPTCNRSLGNWCRHIAG